MNNRKKYILNSKNSKGITLIALVITIVVLLILAGITINMLLDDNGIIKKAQDAKTAMEEAQQNEIDSLKNLENQIDNLDKTAIKFLINSGEDGVVGLPIAYEMKDDIQIDWGDGNKNDDGTTNPYLAKNNNIKIASMNKVKVAKEDPWNSYMHKYVENNKKFIVTIKGDCWGIDSDFRKCSKESIIEVLQWGETGLNYIELMGCSNLRKIASPTQKSFKQVSGFYNTFLGCTSLTSIPEDLFANCPQASDFYGAFAGCTSLTSIPENLFANCPQAIYFEHAFSRMYIFNRKRHTIMGKRNI